MRGAALVLAVFAAVCAVNCEVFYEEKFSDGKYPPSRMSQEGVPCWGVAHVVSGDDYWETVADAFWCVSSLMSF